MASTIFRHRWRAPGGKTQWRGALEGKTPPRRIGSERGAPQAPWTAFSAVSGESGCNKSTNFQQDWRSQTKISRCTDWYYQSVHTSPQSSGPSTIFSSRATKRSPVCPPSGRERTAGGNALHTSIQQYIDSRENDEPPSSLHSILEDDAPITRLSAVRGLEAHLNAGDPTQSESAASRSSNRTLNRLDHENVDSTPQRPLRSALGA